ncbi:T-box transcription factor TBX6L [Osmerus mordax]|uniref:T-box transcription factor TBX6L n=1 Tax=Osmerus mordax TaxID=8014 RepID=UPI00350EADEB
MFLHQERPLCEYQYSLNSQPKNYAYCPPDWKDAAYHGQSWDAGIAGGDTEISSLQVRVSLQGRELWEKFGDLDTEMLITKTGRRMFPSCKVTVTGLNPRAKYVLMMDMIPFDDNKYKWSKDHWEVSGVTDPHLANHFFIHPDSPALGERWMQYPVSFHKLKLTNNTLNSNGLVILHSMHKYLPRLHIIQSPDPCSPFSGGYLCFTFPEAAFIAVTAYQNAEVTKLKIDNNPFAKGFRDSGLNRKRFREKEKTSPDKHVDEQVIIPSNVFRPVDAANENDSTVSSSVDSHGTDYRLDNTPRPTAPNPFISAFMNRGPAALPSEEWANSPQSTPSTRDYSSPVHTEAVCPRLRNVASPLFTHTLGQTHSGLVGFRRPAPYSSRAIGPPQHQGLGAPPPRHHPPPGPQTEHQHQADFDYPLPLPPKVSRIHLSESALRSLDMSPSCDPGSPRPLANILNRIHSRGASVSGSPGKLHQAQYERPSLGLERQLRPPYPPQLEHTGDYLPIHGTMLYQNSLMGPVGPLGDYHGNPRGPPSLEYSYKTPLLDYFLEDQSGK